MTKKESNIEKGLRLISERLQKRGLLVTAKWIFGRGWSRITGLPFLKHSKITPMIYVGPQLNQAGSKMVQKHGIKASVNMRIEHDDAAFGEDLPHYCYVPVIDDDTLSFAQIKKGVEFITEQVKNNRPVYIHCMGGIGRAPTMAAYYFLSTGLSLDKTIQLIEKSRPYINIMPIQFMQLARYERLQDTDDAQGKQVKIHTAHDYQDDFPFDFYKGTSVTVLKSDDDDPRWKKCQLTDGSEGWVPETYLKETNHGWITAENYNAMEMAVTEGETVTVFEELFGWGWAEKKNHQHGWVPIHCYAQKE